MASLNKCMFIGNAGDAPQVRTFENGNKIAQVRIAVTERYTDRNSQPQSVTEWIPLVFNGKLADVAAQFVTKGSSIYVEGRWKSREWADQQGVKHKEVELRVEVLQLLGQRQQQQQNTPATQYPQAAPQYGPQQPAPAPQYPAQYPQTPAPQQPVDDFPAAGGNFDPDLGF